MTEAGTSRGPPLSLIVAMSKNGFIGLGGKLPWHFSEDLRHFKERTMGHAVIMGRKTYDSIGKPLPGRQNIVVTRSSALRIDGCDVVHSLEEALARVRESDTEPFVIGGAELYCAALPFTSRIYLTEVDQEIAGDVRFPEWDRSAWREVMRRPGATHGLTFVTFERVRP